MNLKNFFRFCQRDPKIVTVLPTAQPVSKQELADAELLREFNRRVAENIRSKARERAREVVNLRMRYAEAQRHHYYMQAG